MVIPSGWDLMNGGFVLTKSRTNRGMVDQHDIAISMLQTMLELHGDQLAMARQKGNYSADRYLPTALDEQYMTEAKQLRDEHVETVRRLKAEAAATVRVPALPPCMHGRPHSSLCPCLGLWCAVRVVTRALRLTRAKLRRRSQLPRKTSTAATSRCVTWWTGDFATQLWPLTRCSH